MCDFCRPVLKGVCIKHTIQECPMRRSLFCPSCASYGHAAGRCPTQEMRVDPKNIKKVLQAAGIPSTTQPKNIQALRDIAITSNPPRRLVFGTTN